jgi:hypothetical protein
VEKKQSGQVLLDFMASEKEARYPIFNGATFEMQVQK